MAQVGGQALPLQLLLYALWTQPPPAFQLCLVTAGLTHKATLIWCKLGKLYSNVFPFFKFNFSFSTPVHGQSSVLSSAASTSWWVSVSPTFKWPWIRRTGMSTPSLSGFSGFVELFHDNLLNVTASNGILILAGTSWQHMTLTQDTVNQSVGQGLPTSISLS